MRITEKGQITIPIALRKRYGLQPDIEVEFVAKAEGIQIQKRGTGPANPFRALRGVMKKRLKGDRYIEDLRSR